MRCAVLSAALLGALVVPPFVEAQCVTVVGTLWDAGLQRRWSVLQACGHPERPQMLVLSADTPSAGRSIPPVGQTAPVRAGELVRLWSNAGAVRIEMRAIAEHGGSPGDRISLRLERGAGVEDVWGARLSGIVRGAGDVELER